MNNSLTKITYETSLGTVDLDLPDRLKNYLVRGQSDKITDQEVILFMKTCQAQKLNPFAQGEAYLIKFGSDPAQMVVGKDAYMRRAGGKPGLPGPQVWHRCPPWRAGHPEGRNLPLSG